MGRKFAIVLGFVLLFSQILAQQTSVDEAGQLLNGLSSDTTESIQQLKNNWAENEPLYKAAVDSVEAQQDAKEAECNSKSAAAAQTAADIQTCEDNVDWISNRIKDNIDKVKALEDQRCATTQLYVEGLKNNKIVKSLILFLREAIEKKDSISLVERKQVMGKLLYFMSLYKENKMKEIIQLQEYVNEGDYNVDANAEFKRRTAEEIGEGHVDDGRERINLDDFDPSARTDWAGYKQQLLDLLQQFEDTINSNMQSAQDDEVRAGVALADFKIQIERENKELDKFLYSEMERHGQLKAQLVVDQKAADQCNTELEVVNGELENARDGYQEQVDKYETQLKSLQEQLALFQYVQQLYHSNVGSKEGEYKNRVDDYLADGGFEDYSYNSRKVNEFSL